MTPEQLLGGSSTMRSDLYALGLAISEVFTGQRAYPKHALVKLAQRLQRNETVVPPAPELGLQLADLDPVVGQILHWCPANTKSTSQSQLLLSAHGGCDDVLPFCRRLLGDTPQDTGICERG